MAKPTLNMAIIGDVEKVLGNSSSLKKMEKKIGEMNLYIAECSHEIAKLESELIGSHGATIVLSTIPEDFGEAEKTLGIAQKRIALLKMKEHLKILETQLENIEKDLSEETLRISTIKDSLSPVVSANLDLLSELVKTKSSVEQKEIKKEEATTCYKARANELSTELELWKEKSSGKSLPIAESRISQLEKLLEKETYNYKEAIETIDIHLEDLREGFVDLKEKVQQIFLLDSDMDDYFMFNDNDHNE